MDSTNCSRPSRWVAPARFESLESRRLLSGYSLVDVNWLPADATGPVNIADSGLFTVGAYVGNNATMYASCLTRRRAYAAPKGFEYSPVNSSGELVGVTSDFQEEIDVNGTISRLPALTGVQNFVPSGTGFSSTLVLPDITESGKIAGIITCNIAGPISSNWFGVVAEYDPTTNQYTGISAIGEIDLNDRAFINDAGVIAYGGGNITEHPSIYDPGTGHVTQISGTDQFSRVTGINNHNQVIGTNFLYDANSATLLKFTSSRTQKSFAPAGINDSGVIVGTAQFRVRARHHFAWVQHAAMFANGKLTDLNTLVQADEIITGAVSINSSGQILASTMKGTAAGVCVLTPSGL